MANNVGVFVERGTAGPLAFGPDPGDSVFLAATALRGPSNVPVLITSMSRYRATFGESTDPAAMVAEIMFSKGVRRLYVTRVVGAGALTANVVLVDGVGENTLRVEAKGEGAWANDHTVAVASGSAANTVKLTVANGDGDALEVWDNIKVEAASLERLNASSAYLKLVDLASPTAAPGNLPVTGSFGLSAGQAGVDAAPDAAAVVGTENMGVKTGLKVFRDRRLGRGFLLAPDLDFDASVRAEMNGQIEGFYRVPLFSGPAEGSTPTQALADVASAKAAIGGGYYYPRAQARAFDGSVKTIPITGHVAADWIAAIAEQGPGKAPAGANFRVNYVLGLESQPNGQPLVDAPTAELLVGAGINPAYDRNGQGPKLWGARSASEEAAWQYLHSVYLYCLIGSRVQESLDTLVYDVADELFFTQLRLGVRQFLVSLHGQRAFNGEVQPDGESFDATTHAFGVAADESLLSATDRNNGIVRVKIVFRPALTAETIEVEVAKQNEV